MNQIIIEVSGGLVQAVYADNPDIDVRILDWDNIDSENMTAEQKQIENDIKSMKDIL